MLAARGKGQYMKIQIIGYSGSGKSTLARKLAAFYGIPFLHLDCVQFYGDWQERSKEEQSEIVRRFLAENESWVIDGNYSKVAPERFKMSDLTIYLNYGRFYCYKKAKERYLTYKGRSRESCPCNEKFDFVFRKWLLWDGRRKERRKKNLSHLNMTQGEKRMFRNVKELSAWLKEIGCEM